jgi:hypothetical protein
MPLTDAKLRTLKPEARPRSGEPTVVLAAILRGFISASSGRASTARAKVSNRRSTRAHSVWASIASAVAVGSGPAPPPHRLSGWPGRAPPSTPRESRRRAPSARWLLDLGLGPRRAAASVQTSGLATPSSSSTAQCIARPAAPCRLAGQRAPAFLLQDRRALPAAPHPRRGATARERLESGGELIFACGAGRRPPGGRWRSRLGLPCFHQARRGRWSRCAAAQGVRWYICWYQLFQRLRFLTDQPQRPPRSDVPERY